MFSNYLTNNYPQAIKFLTNAILKQKLANSYILVGNNTDDINSLVINLAKILNCKKNINSFSTPCETCLSCKWLEKNEYSQALIKISPNASNKKENKKEQIKIDTIRELLTTIKTTADYFRVIFFENSSLNSLPAESCNLLLKTVEETPTNTVFIFANSTQNDILKTILSRSQIIYLNKKCNSFNEAVTINSSLEIEKDLLDYSPQNTQKGLEKAKKIIDTLDKEEINLKDLLTKIAVSNYNSCKYLSPEKYTFVYERLLNAYKKYKAFMQPKVIIQDLFLECSV